MSRQPYTDKRMQAVADWSKAQYLRMHLANAALLGEISCEYAGVVQADGTCHPQAPIRANSKVAFWWRAVSDGPQSMLMEALCKHAVSRGIAFPPSWLVAQRCHDLQAIADASAAQAVKLFSLPDANCKVLGQPRRCPLPNKADRVVPGAIVELRLESAAVEFLLCARVHDDVWLCTQGYFIEDAFQAIDPFGEASIVPKNIQCDVWQEDSPADRVCVRPHLRPGRLRELAITKPDQWDLAVAMATWRAEMMQARLEGRVPDGQQAHSAFERNPFQWHAASGRSDRPAVATLWSWYQADQHHEVFQTSRLNHVWERGFQTPWQASSPDEALWHKLRAAAEEETHKRKAPCAYLGQAVVGGKFIADPDKWPAKYDAVADERKTKTMVHFEWAGVSVDGKPYITAASVNDILKNGRTIPQNPLSHTAPSGLKFSPQFMDCVAQNVHEGIRFKGSAFEGERLTIMRQGGIDLQDEHMHWTLPDGRCECWSVRRIAGATDDLLAPQDSEGAYQAVAKEIGYDVLGIAEENALEPFRIAPGTLVERLWEKIDWQCPADETCSCWFVANAGEPDKTSPVKLVAKSLASLRLELRAARCATAVKLRQTWERRLEENGMAADVLLNNADLWRHVRGPDPETLRNPFEIDLKAARLAVHRLRCMLITHGPNAQDGLDVYAEEIFRAVGQLKEVTWEAIRRERFFLTPKGFFDELVRNAQKHMRNRADESARRQARLSVEVELAEEAREPRPEDDSPHPTDPRFKDRFKLNLDDFKNKNRRKPNKWQRGVRQASEVLLDEMRVLLSTHYDSVHLAAWEARQRKLDKKAPERKDEYKVFRSAAQARLRHQNIRMELPQTVKAIFQRTEDEASWGNLEAFRDVICSLLEAETTADFEVPGELEELAAALSKSTSRKFPDEVGPGSKLDKGSRVMLWSSPEFPLKPHVLERARLECIQEVMTLVQDDEDVVTLRVRRRPCETDLAPPLAPMAKALFKRGDLQHLDVARHNTMQGVFDSMLLVLWDALFLNQCEKWTRAHVANLPSDECLELARWFLWGQAWSSKALLDGICSQCGAFLHGACNQNSALSNKCSAPPTNRDGQPLFHDDGSPKTEAQPPFLLRWSPALYAKEAPAIFAHDPETNTVALQPGVHEPWLAKCSTEGAANTWLYCRDCKQRWFPERRGQSHIPFRDAASQAFLKPVRRHAGKPVQCAPETNGPAPDSLAERAKHDESDEEHLQVDELPLPDQASEVDDDFKNLEIPDLPAAPQPRPTLVQYKERWGEKLATHTRETPGDFARDNLCPKPVPQLWQDVPHVPFDDLKSTEAQSRLSVCRPHSSLEPANCADGVPRYAHIQGDVCYRRRAMLQLASTMGFLLNKQSGHFMRLTPSETDAVHEVLSWLRAGNNKILSFYSTNFEAFQQACSKLMSRFQPVIPEGCLRARIRATNRESREPKEGTLADTLGDETTGMVVVDVAGHPLKYDALSVFESVVATQSARLELEVPGPYGKGWQRTGNFVDTGGDAMLDDAWKSDIASGSKHILEETWVPANDPHYDARVFPVVHPYGTGSLLAEAGSGGTQRHACNRLMLVQSWFRRSSLWGFWFLNRLIQTELFFKNKRRRATGRRGASSAADPDPVTRLFGTAQPSDIPESSEWWKRQQRDLFAITDDAEMGLMQCMLTVTANDSSPEMLAAIRRGPFAQPTEEEHIEYLLQRKRREQERPAFENYSLEHVLAFQRRVGALKNNFMQRGACTPLGTIRDWWDRTEAQMRAALHAHILVWMKQRQQPKEYEFLQPVPREAPGTEPRQRPSNQKVLKLSEDDYQEDNCYHRAEFGRIWTEMVRPSTDGKAHGGFADYEKLRIAGLARQVQTKLYLHSCSNKYCLQGRSSCRFFFPWPEQPQQQYDLNTERVAGQRRLEEDDQWVNPHELYMAMFSPATVHCLPFDPRYGTDTARQYCSKYASKPEKSYYLETQRGSVRDFIKARTVGMCMAHNRLLGYRVVRNTRPVQYTPTEFIPARESCTPREPEHIERLPGYPNPKFYLSHAGKYFFRHPSLRHLRLEQYNRYFANSGDRGAMEGPTIEDTVLEDDSAVQTEHGHRHYNEMAEKVAPGTVFPASAPGVDNVRRRRQARLAVSRVPFIEPLADKREAFYEQRLLLGLAWFCPEPPKEQADGVIVWRFFWEPPTDEQLGGVQLEPQELCLGKEAISFEHRCAVFERRLCQNEYGLICPCCAEESPDIVCNACKYAVGFHKCAQTDHLRWRKGTLFAGELDVQRVLYNLHRRGLPTATLHRKAIEYVEAGLLRDEDAKAMVHTIEQERRVARIYNQVGGVDDAPGDCNSSNFTSQDLVALLAERETKLRASDSGGVTDQWRVYSEIVDALSTGRRLRMLVQASAGTGKSFMMTTVMLWCVVNNKKAKAAAPTGIAASNIEIEGTSVSATTLHAMFDFDTELTTKLDFSKGVANKKIKELLELEVLFLDEVSMIDSDAWSAMAEMCSLADDSRRPDAPIDGDPFGNVALVLLGDFKQLPPATSKAPFIVDAWVCERFDFRVLRQNRRVVAGDASRAEELEEFHGVLHDISYGRATDRVKRFIVQCYVRGAAVGCAERAQLEGSTFVATKRRIRDRWNRAIVRRIAKFHNHTLKIKGRVRARGARGKDWFSERRSELARKRSRTQALWHLHIAGDWHPSSETMPPRRRCHMMRCMLVSNLALDQRFCNGAQGRLLHWHPKEVKARKAISASHPELLVRFAKESALAKAEMMPDVDFMDVTCRQETLVTIPGAPVLLQEPLVPCYGLTIHKTQALSLRHIVHGCLEGTFAFGQVYVLASRVTDPQLLHLVGLPPMDLLTEIYDALKAAGFDPVECLRRCATVTNDFVYRPGPRDLRDRFTPRFVKERTIPVVARELKQMLDPQPRAAEVMHRLLDWIERADLASQRGEAKPPFATVQGEPIFPGDEDPWWLTDVQRKSTAEEILPGNEDGPAEEEGDVVDEIGELTDDEDPPSSEGEASPEGGDDEEAALQPLERPPRVAWRRAVSGYAGHFERQRGAHCGMHALNNAVGCSWQTVEDMQRACDDYLVSSRHEGMLEIRRAEHAKPSGWYSIEVMCHAMNTTSMRVAGKVEFALSLEPLHVNPNALRTSVGAVVNIKNRHWVALKRDGEQVWLLDSQEPMPSRLTEAEYKVLIFRYRNAFPIRRVEDMESSCARTLRRKLSSSSVMPSTATSEELSAGVPADASTSLASDGRDTRVSRIVLTAISGQEGAVPAPTVAERRGAADAMDITREAHGDHTREASGGMSTSLASRKATRLDGPATAALDHRGPGNTADSMEMDTAAPLLASLQQHGADEVQATMQGAFHERAWALEADMLSAHEAVLQVTAGAIDSVHVPE